MPLTFSRAVDLTKVVNEPFHYLVGRFNKVHYLF